MFDWFLAPLEQPKSYKHIHGQLWNDIVLHNQTLPIQRWSVNVWSVEPRYSAKTIFSQRQSHVFYLLHIRSATASVLH